MNVAADSRRSLTHSTGWPVDAHVHLHHRDLAAVTLDAAAENYRMLCGRSQTFLGALLLVQSAGERVFECLADGRASLGGWVLEPAAAEHESLIARRDGASLALVCGRQVRAEGGLEVLALGTRREFSDGKSLADTVAEVRGAGALAVLPWGFGKWLGRRKRIVEAALDSSAPAELFIGDNGGRTALAVPALLRDAQRRGFRVLPGTDPFPFGGDFRRVGGFGFFADGAPGESAPWRDLRDWLLARSGSPPPFGRACGPLRFAFNQVGIQVYNRMFRSVSP